MSTHSLDSAIEASHKALAKIVNGDPSGYLALYAQDEEVTIRCRLPHIHQDMPSAEIETMRPQARVYEQAAISRLHEVRKCTSLANAWWASVPRAHCS